MSFGKTLKETLKIRLDKAFGLDIGDRSIEIIELEKVFKFSVVTYGRTELEPGIVENGRIIDQNILAEKLKKLLKEAKPKRVSTNKVILSLPESQVFIKCLEVDAKLKSNNLINTITEKISLSTPINLDKSYWDFIEKPLADKTKKMIIFIGVAKDIANSYVKFCNSIGLEVVSLCVESLSLARVLLKSSSKQSLVMDIGSSSTNLSFFDSNDKINMVVDVPVAGEQMTEAVKYGLKVDIGEAEALKVKSGFKSTGDNPVRPLILPVLTDILNETKQAINYYENTFKQKLDDVFLVGGSSLLPDIAGTIKTELGREVQIASSIYNLNLGPITNKVGGFPIFANVIGLGMLGASGEFKDLNLLRKMPSEEVNSVNKLNLFRMGYLSKVNAFRTVMNNKFVLAVMVILVGVIFAVLYQQAQNFGLDDAKPANTVSTNIRPVTNKNLVSSTTLKVSTTTKILPKSTSTKPVSAR